MVKDQVKDWLIHPITIELFQNLEEIRHSLEKRLLEGSIGSEDYIDREYIKTITKMQIIGNVLDNKYIETEE